MATKIKGVDGMAPGELLHQIELGGRFVYYKYTISVGVMTFRRGSDIYFVKANESRVAKGLGWTALSFLLGWWGIPWGPIWTVGSLWTNLHGGVDVTSQAVASLGLGNAGARPAPAPPLPPGNVVPPTPPR